MDRGRADKSELETILSKRQEYEAAKKRHDEANHQIQLALPYCLDERACQPYYDIRRENKSIMDKIVREHPLVYHIKDRRDAKALRREINSAFDDIGDAISGIMNRIVEGKYPIWRFDALIEELLEKYTPEEAEQIKAHLARMKRSEDIKDLVLTIGSVTLSVLTLHCISGQAGGELTDSKSTEQELADIVSSIRKSLEGTTVLEDFDKEQQAWEIYRELHMRTLFPESINGVRMLWGSILSHDAAEELRKIDEERVRTLKRYKETSYRAGTDGSGLFKEYLEELMRMQ